MCKLYQFFNRFGFILAIIAALAMPIFVLCATASAAEIQMYLYNGVEFPDINSVWTDKEKFPYALIMYSDYYRVDVLLLVDKRFEYDSSSKYLSPLGGNFTWEMYKVVSDGTWSRLNYSNDSSGIGTTRITWTSADIFSSGSSNVYLAASDPVPIGGSSLEFEVSASWEDTTYQYDVGETADVFSVSTDLGTEYDISYQWFGKAYEVSEFTALTGETFSTFVPQTDDEHVGSFTYYCSVTATDGSQSVTVDSPFLYVTVYEAPEYTDPTVDETDKKLDGIKDSLGDIQNSIDDILTGSDEHQSAADDFKNQAANDAQKIDDAVQALDQIGMPNIDDINIGIIDMIDASGFLAVNAILGVLWNNNIIMTVMTFAFVLAMVAFFIFGKR